MNQIAKELREAADYMKREGVDLLGAVIRLNNTFDAINPGTPAANLGAIVAYIADELDELDDKATRRRSHIVKLESTIAERNRELRELRKQVPTERDRRILDMWPRFEDGDPVMPGDKVHYASTHNVETEIEVESITVMDGLFVLCDDECRSNQYEQGQRVKRPARSVLDADGVETKSGDTVYLLKDGDKCRVTGFETIDGEVFARLHCDDRPEIEGARGSAITHRRRVLDSDGVEIRAGDTVWFRSLSTGDRMRKATVTGFGEHSLDGPLATVEDEAGKTWHIDPKKITHVQPDSWQRLEEDVHVIVTGDGMYHRLNNYCNARDLGGGDVMCLTIGDLVRRAKALAGVEVD